MVFFSIIMNDSVGGFIIKFLSECFIPSWFFFLLRHKRASSKLYTTASQALLPGTHVSQLNLENYFMYYQRANRLLTIQGFSKVFVRWWKKGLACILKDSWRIDSWRILEGFLEYFWRILGGLLELTIKWNFSVSLKSKIQRKGFKLFIPKSDMQYVRIVYYYIHKGTFL